jgi:hypothetical protein
MSIFKIYYYVIILVCLRRLGCRLEKKPFGGGGGGLKLSVEIKVQLG